MTIDALAELEQAGAVLLNRHFVYVSGKHGSGYINADPLFPNIALLSQLCDLLAQPFLGQIDTVAAPATGGIVLAALTARAFVDHSEDVKGVWADKTGDREFVFERDGFVQQIQGKRVLVVEDLVNTGSSIEKVCRLVERHGGELVGASVIGERGNVTAEELGLRRYEALVSVKLEAMDADVCSLCANNVPIVEDIGHGDKFKVENPNYAGGYVRLIADSKP